MTRRLRVLLRFLFIALCSLIIGVLLLTLGVLLVLKDHDDQAAVFQQQTWLTTGRRLHGNGKGLGELLNHNPRENMAQDVMAQYLHAGMTRAQVVALLGPPDEQVGSDGGSVADSLAGKESRASFPQKHHPPAAPPTFIHYWVGTDGLDLTSLRIQLDSEGKVKTYQVVSH
jgi:hypothetical protein